MIDYKKKILKYKTKYLKLIKEKKKIYGGNIYEQEINPDIFKNLLITYADNLEEHAKYYMFERDIAHDFKEVSSLYFTKYHPYDFLSDTGELDEDIQYKIKNSNEHFHTLKYILNNNLDVILYSVDKNIKYKDSPTTNNERCILNYSTDENQACAILSEQDKMSMPFNHSTNLLPYLYYDSGSTGHFSKFNLSWTNLFDPSTTANKLVNLAPDTSSYQIHNINSVDKESEDNKLIEFLNHKWQQTLIFSWYSKTGTKISDIININELWPQDYKNIDNHEHLSNRYKLNSSEIVESNKNYKRLYIAINILRLLHITFDKEEYEKGYIVAKFKFSNDIKSEQYKKINAIIKEYDEKFRNPLLCTIKRSDVLADDSDLFNLPISAADTFLAFISKTDWPGKKARGNKKENSETIKMGNDLIPIIKNICTKSPGLNFTAKDIKRVILYIGVLLKYSIGDTTFILAQLYDKQVGRNKHYLRSFDNFLNMRNLIFKNNIIGEANKNKLFKLYNYQLDKTGDVLNNYLENYNIFYSVKFSLTNGEFKKEYYRIRDFNLSDNEWYGTYKQLSEYWKERELFWNKTTDDDGNDKLSEVEAFYNNLNQKPGVNDNDEFNMNEEDKNKFDEIKKKFLEFNEIYNIFYNISNLEVTEIDTIINITETNIDNNQINIASNEFDKNILLLFKNFLYSILELYDNRINSERPIRIYTTDFKIGDNFQYNSPLLNLPMTEENKNNLTNYTSLLDKISNYLILFADIKKYSNHAPVQLVMNNIEQILEYNFHRTTEYDSNISGYRNLGKYTETLLAMKKSSHINIKDFLNVVNIRIFDNVRKQHLVGWYQFGNVSSIFDNFYETYNKFLTDYNISNTKLQTGGSSIYEDYSYLPISVVDHRIIPLLNKNKNLHQIIVDALVGTDTDENEENTTDTNFNLIDIAIIFIIELLSNVTFFKDKTGNVHSYPKEDNEDILEFDNLVRLRDFLDEFNQAPIDQINQDSCFSINEHDYNQIEAYLNNQKSNIIQDILEYSYYDSNPTDKKDYSEEIETITNKYFKKLDELDKIEKDISKINIYKKIITKIINNYMKENIHPKIKNKIILFRESNFMARKTAGRQEDNFFENTVANDFNDSDVKTMYRPMEDSHIGLNLELDDDKQLHHKLATCKFNASNDCTNEVLIENKEVNSNFEFYMMTEYLSTYLFKTDLSKPETDVDNNNFYKKNLRTFNMYFKLYYAFFNYFNINKESENENEKKNIDDYGIIDIYNSFGTSLNSFITDIINLMYNDKIIDVIISWTNNINNVKIGEIISREILNNGKFYTDGSVATERHISGTNVIQELLISHSDIIKLINAYENNNDDEVVEISKKLINDENVTI